MILIEKIGVIIPAYDVEDWIGGVLAGVIRHIPRDRIIVVDDGSRDDTAKAVSRTGIRVIRHPINRGKGEALKSGFRAAMEGGLDAVITLDGDAQHDPDSIPDFISRMSETRSDLVVGTRLFRMGSMPPDRIFSNQMSSFWVSVFSRKWIPDSQCGYRLIRTNALRAIALRTSHYEMETELIVKLVRKGYRVSFCPIQVKPSSGTSHIRRFRDTARFCSLLLSLLTDRK